MPILIVVLLLTTAYYCTLRWTCSSAASTCALDVLIVGKMFHVLTPASPTVVLLHLLLNQVSAFLSRTTRAIPSAVTMTYIYGIMVVVVLVVCVMAAKQHVVGEGVVLEIN